MLGDSFSRQSWLIAAGVGSGLVMIGLIFLLRFRQPVKLEIINNSTATVSATIWVDVGGAVANPGVYELSSEARVKDALASAGGLTAEADREQLARTVNLAAPLKDGSKLYFASINESASVSIMGDKTLSNQVNINTSTASVLEKLEGIGPTRAEAIIFGRPYADIEELKTRKVIPESVFIKIKDQLTVY